MKILKGCLCLVVLLGALIGCKDGTVAEAEASNPLIGTWNLAMPNPPVVNQNVTTPCNSKIVFTKLSVEYFMGDKTGGPGMISYLVDGDTVWVIGQINKVPHKLDGKDKMSWNSPYGLCFYKRAN
ncbi:MAG TPA: hypothetical protein VGG56_08135 [Terracidiphilus sp.]|jgi:hypothetical protein